MSEHSRDSSAIARVSTLACAGALMFFLSLSGRAETIAIPLGQQGKAWSVETPTTGMRKDQVEEKFGPPAEKSGPVGTPPIYTWDYSQFTVYFESDHVIHSVVKAPPKPQ